MSHSRFEMLKEKAESVRKMILGESLDKSAWTDTNEQEIHVCILS